MRKLIKYLPLICVGALILSIYYSFEIFGVHSQTNKISNTMVLSNSTVNSKFFESTVTNNQSNSIETKAGIISRKTEREGICSSGFREIPIELRRVYDEQTKQVENNVNSSDWVYKLRFEVGFYGFTYPFRDTENLKRDETQCTDQPLEPEKINFVSPRINKSVKKYMSALIYNETQINATLRKMSERPDAIYKVYLCLDIECGTENPKAEKQSFDILVNGDLVYAKSYSSTQIYGSVLNDLRSMTQSDESQHLTDSEIKQILFIAGKIALANSGINNN
jgi:hypothetical protein